jgi:hypothetical protein
MPAHFTESQIGLHTLAWCPTYGRLTNHRIDRVAVGSHAGKVGPCTEHGPKHELTQEQKQRREKQRQKELFP